MTTASPLDVPVLPIDRPGIRHRPQVPELVGVDQRPDGLDLPVKDVERQHEEHPATRVTDDRARLTIDLLRLDDEPDLVELRCDRDQEPGNVLGPDHAASKRRRLAPTIADERHVSREQLEQPVHIPRRESLEERGGELLTDAPVASNRGRPSSM
jgi:hypothetical protein